MGKGYKRKTRWRTLNLGAPPGEEDEEDGIRSGYAKAQENSRNGQSGHKNGRAHSAGSATSDYASTYASAASKSRRQESGGLPTKPKFIFNENEYTRITTPRQDVLFKKGYLSRKKVCASTASTSATPSTTESQSASHSTADGSETNEDQQLLDSKENGAAEYAAMMEPGAQVPYGTFYDHASGYYYEYPVMVVGPGPVMPGGPSMHNVLTAVPCGPVPLRPIEWVNPAFVPELGNEHFCLVDYQTAQLGQYPTLVDENGVPLTAQTENSNGSDEACPENGDQSASWAGSVADEEQSGNSAETQNGTTETSSTNETEEAARAPVNPEIFLETALAQQLHVSHVTSSPIPEPYVYPNPYMSGPALINVNGVTIQNGPMVRNTGITGSSTNIGACARRRKKIKLSKRKSRRPLGPGNAEDEKEEAEYGSEVKHVAGLSKLGVVDEASTAEIAKVDALSAETVRPTSRPLNPECQEFRPVLESRTITASIEATSGSEATTSDQTSSGQSSSVESTDKEQRIIEKTGAQDESTKIIAPEPPEPLGDGENPKEEISPKKVAEKSHTSTVDSDQKLSSTQQNEEIEAAPVDFDAAVFANVTAIAQRALAASRSVVEGTVMETETGLEATNVNFQEIMENLENGTNESNPHREEVVTNGKGHGGSVEKEKVSNGLNDRCKSCERSPTSERSLEIVPGASETIGDRDPRDSTTNEKRGSRSASPGMINRTTTPINANSHRLPESYESLVTRGTSLVSCSLPSLGTTSAQQAARNRKYSSKNPKFVRDATPGPDLDEVEIQKNCQKIEERRARNEVANSVSKPSDPTRTYRNSLENNHIDNDAIETGVEAPEMELQSLSTLEGSGSYGWEKRTNNADLSNDDSGIETQTRFSSDHPITDAVTEWLQRANSPELFVTAGTTSEPEDDELENEEPPKNLQGNPMPALSANSSSVINTEFSRFAGFGKLASFFDATLESTTKEHGTKCKKNDDIEITRARNEEASLVSRRKRRADCNKRTTKKNASLDASRTSSRAQIKVDVKTNAEAARQRLSENNTNSSSSCGSKVEEKTKVREACELTERDSVAGMRVAKSSRMKKNNMASITSTAINDSCKSPIVVDKTTRLKNNDKTNRVNALASENVEVAVRRVGVDENDEGIVEDEEIRVRTFEKGQIVVSIEGKVLPVDNYQPVLKNSDARIENEEGRMFTDITHEESQREETSESENPSKRNSLGSIDEPDVLECWEIETVEPITTPKRIIQAEGRSLMGEDADDDNVKIIDTAGMEIVRKYYRLEASRDSGTSLTSNRDDDHNDNYDNCSVAKVRIVSSSNSIIESTRSDEIPVIGERINKIVEIMLERSGIPVEEAVEVYESCYGGEQRPYLVGIDAKYRKRNILFGQDPERVGAVPCKAACCNLQ